MLVHRRDRARTEAPVRELGGRPYIADFTRLEDVRALATTVLAHEPRLDVLVCNAGIGFLSPRGFPPPAPGWSGGGTRSTPTGSP